MTRELRGAEVARSLCEGCADRVAALARLGAAPTLGILRVGEDAGVLSYERGVLKRAEVLGVRVVRRVLPLTAAREALLEEIDSFNADDGVHGVLMFRPLPPALRAFEAEICDRLRPEKDVDGMSAHSAAGVYLGGGAGFAPCTPCACMAMLDHFGIELSGRRAVVIGRSPVVGRPISMLLLARDASVTICHSRSRDLARIAREADILIAAAGRARLVNADFVRPGQCVIDVGINSFQKPDGGWGIVGDCDYEAVAPIVDAISPVPGGVGAVTSAVLMAHVIEAAERRAGLGKI